jgi:hypothetical protein
MVYVYNSSYSGSKGRKITVPACPGQKNKKLYEKQSKSVGGVVQMIECLSMKNKALSSNPMPPKKGTF